MTDKQQTYKDQVKRFANGRSICNCGEGYLTNCGEALISTGIGFKRVLDYPCCAYGCSANQLSTKYEIVEKLVG